MPAFDATYLDTLSELIARRTGLNTFEHARSRLIDVLQQRTLASYEPHQFLKHLRHLHEDHSIWQTLLAELTVGETYFMRDERQIEALRDHILPVLIAEKRKKGVRTLNIWSAGCATGEEAYTLAMLLADLLPDRPHWHIDILGTDINEAAIEVAQAANYRDWSFRNADNAIQQRFFTPLDLASPPTYRVNYEIQSMVRFAHDNLMAPRVTHRMQDLILCRNVLIYFTREQTRRLEDHLHQFLRSGGWLMLSPVENLQHIRRGYRVQHIAGTLVYQKKPDPAYSIQPTITPSRIPVSASGDVDEVMDEEGIYQQQLYQQAVHQMQTGHLEAARQLAEQSREYRVTPAVCSLLGSILASKGELDAATDYLLEALARDKLYADAHYLLALIQMESGQFTAARTSIRAAIYCRPDFALAHLLSGDLFAQQNNNERACHAWQTARRFASTLPASLYVSDVADVQAGQLVRLANDRLAEQTDVQNH